MSFWLSMKVTEFLCTCGFVSKTIFIFLIRHFWRESDINFDLENLKISRSEQCFMLFYLLINCSKLIFGKIVSVINPLLDAKEIFELTQMFAYKHHIKRLVFIKLSFDFSTFLAFSKCSIIDQGSIFVRVACPLIFVGQFFYVSYAQNLQLKKIAQWYETIWIVLWHSQNPTFFGHS